MPTSSRRYSLFYRTLPTAASRLGRSSTTTTKTGASEAQRFMPPNMAQRGHLRPQLRPVNHHEPPRLGIVGRRRQPRRLEALFQFLPFDGTVRIAADTLRQRASSAKFSIQHAFLSFAAAKATDGPRHGPPLALRRHALPCGTKRSGRMLPNRIRPDQHSIHALPYSRRANPR